MTRKLFVLLLLAALLTAGAGPIVGASAESREPTPEEIEALRPEIEREIAEFEAAMAAPSTMSAAEAADVLAARFAGRAVGEADLLEAVKFLRDAANAPNADSAIALELVESYLVAQKQGIAREAVADKEGFDALLASGELARLTPEEGAERLLALGLDPAGIEKNAAVFARGVGATPEEVVAWARGLAQGTNVWHQGDWDNHGIAMTGVWLAAAVVTGNGEFLPHNLRVNAFQLNARVWTGSGGSWTNGYVFVQVDVEALAAAALDWHTNVDTALLNLPLSVRVTLHYGITCGWLGCWPYVYVTVTFPETLFASNVRYEFAYPVTAGTFPTRAESMDILQSLYDRLGYLAYQSGHRDWTSAPPARPSTPVPPPSLPDWPPGLGDLSTQAPIVNWFGTQTPPSSVPSAPATPPTPVTVTPPHNRVRSLPSDFPNGVDATGVTAGYDAAATISWHPSLLIVRWHNVGAGTEGRAVREAPASIYYDATGHFTRGSGNVMTSDWSIVENLGV